MDRNSEDTHIENLRVQVPKNRDNIPGLKLTIDKTWDGNPVGHRPTDIHLGWKFEKIPNRPHKRVVTVEFTTPFYDDPEPEMMPGVTPGLWEYEVLELFFANDNNQYLEVEVSPHGHWLCLLFDGVRTCFNNGEELELTVQNQWIGGDIWKGNVEIPLAYFPANVTKMNAYTIHGTGEDRVYEAMRPVTDGTHEEPDFHRLEFFRRIDRQKFIPPPYGTSPFKDWKYGDLWEGHY